MTDKLKVLLRKEFPLWDMRGANEAEHHCELTLFHDRKRLHALLDAFDEPAVEAAQIERYAPDSNMPEEMIPWDEGQWVRYDDHRRILAGVNQQAGSGVPEGAEQIAFVLRQIGSMDAEDIDGDDVGLRFEDSEGFDTGCDVSIVEYAEKAADLIYSMIEVQK